MLRAVIILLLYVEPGMPPPAVVVVVKVVLAMEEEDVLDVGASVEVFADIGIRRCAEKRTELKTLVYMYTACVCLGF